MTLIPQAKGVIQKCITNLFSNTIYRMIYWSKKKWNPEIRIPSLRRLINWCLKILIFNAVMSKPRLTFTNKSGGFLKIA